jgi:hypothetical protein
MWRQFSFWRRSAAVSAASSDGVSPFEARRRGALRLACCRHPAGGKGGDRTGTEQLLADHPHDYALPARRWQHTKQARQGRPGELASGTRETPALHQDENCCQCGFDCRNSPAIPSPNSFALWSSAVGSTLHRPASRGTLSTLPRCISWGGKCGGLASP